MPSQMVLVEGIVITGGGTIVIVLVDTAILLHSVNPVTDKVSTISPKAPGVGTIVGFNWFWVPDAIVAGPVKVQLILVNTEGS